jgi:hypothetical protein
MYRKENPPSSIFTEFPVLCTNLKSKTCQPLLHVSHSISFDFDGSTRPNPDDIISWIPGNRNLQRRSQFIQKDILIARYLFDASCYLGTIFSGTNHRQQESNFKFEHLGTKQGLSNPCNNSPEFRIDGQKSNGVVGFIFGSCHSKGIFRKRLDDILRWRWIPSIGQKSWRIGNGGWKLRLWNIQFNLVVTPIFEIDAASGRVLFEESFDLSGRVLLSNSNVVGERRLERRCWCRYCSHCGSLYLTRRQPL